MKNTALLLSLALASAVAFAEPETAESDKPLDKLPPHFESLELTDEQKEEMRKIKEAGGSRQEIHSVLTPEQQEQLKNSKHAKGGERGKMDRMKRHLDLSDEQVAEMEKIRAAGGSRQEMFQVLTDDQRQKLMERRGNRKARPQGEAESA